MLAGLLAAVGLMVVPTNAGRADDTDAPIVTARSFAPIPFARAFAVETDDDSERNLELCDAVRLELVVRRRPVAADGPLRLRVSGDHVASVALERAAPDDRLDLPGDRLPMIRDDLGTALPERSMVPLPPRERRDGPLYYRLQATVEERAGGRVLWKGEALGLPKVGEVDERMLGRRLAAALVSKLGRAIEPGS